MPSFRVCAKTNKYAPFASIVNIYRPLLNLFIMRPKASRITKNSTLIVHDFSFSEFSIKIFATYAEEKTAKLRKIYSGN
jgi:hypothetical protein